MTHQKLAEAEVWLAHYPFGSVKHKLCGLQDNKASEIPHESKKHAKLHCVRAKIRFLRPTNHENPNIFSTFALV